MSDYKGARYIGLNEIHLFDGNLIANGEITTLLSEEAALNDNDFEPVYGSIEKEKKPVEKQVKKTKKGGKE